MIVLSQHLGKVGIAVVLASDTNERFPGHYVVIHQAVHSELFLGTPLA
jgi:hypothetical protein